MGLTVQYLVVGAIVAVVLVLIVIRVAKLAKGDTVCANCSLRECCKNRKEKTAETCEKCSCSEKNSSDCLHN